MYGQIFTDLTISFRRDIHYHEYLHEKCSVHVHVFKYIDISILFNPADMNPSQCELSWCYGCNEKHFQTFDLINKHNLHAISSVMTKAYIVPSRTEYIFSNLNVDSSLYYKTPECEIKLDNEQLISYIIREMPRPMVYYGSYNVLVVKFKVWHQKGLICSINCRKGYPPHKISHISFEIYYANRAITTKIPPARIEHNMFYIIPTP